MKRTIFFTSVSAALVVGIALYFSGLKLKNSDSLHAQSALLFQAEPARSIAAQTNFTQPQPPQARGSQKPNLGETLAQAKSENWPRLEDNGEAYLFLKNVRAIKSEDASRVDRKNLLETKFGYSLIMDSSAVNDPSALPKVFYHEQTRSLAIITGVLKVQMGSLELKNEIPNKVGVEFVQSFDHLNLAYFRAPQQSSYDDLISKLDQIRKFPNVRQADLEILENMAQF